LFLNLRLALSYDVSDRPGPCGKTLDTVLDYFWTIMTAGRGRSRMQELLNLISNGFYAAMKRKGQGNGGVYEPTLLAGTKNLGDKVEIRIRDNGTGVPPEVKEKMFNPFFTTKPAGEGTGLGLSLSYDIIVKQHAGTIEVETEPGVFTEFRIVLPRTGSPA
jgi:signal transduction histidine kinase